MGMRMSWYGNENGLVWALGLVSMGMRIGCMGTRMSCMGMRMSCMGM